VTKLNVHTRVIAEDYDFESVRELELSCSNCGTVIPDSTVERLTSEPEFPHICRQCGHVAKLALAELDKLADSLSWTIPELEQYVDN
jgi:rRNA maturation endonuclease Nob1